MRYGRAVRMLVVAVIFIGGAGARAAAPSEARCIAAKARAAADVVRRVSACHAKNALAGGTAGPTCFAAAARRMPDALARADAIGPCGGDHRYLGELARSHCITVPNAFDRCTATKIRAAGSLAAGRLRCLGQGGGTADPECVARRQAQFLNEFTRAERRGPCAGTAEQFADNVDACIADFGIALGCGNGRIDRGEQCDGQMFCTVRECRIRSEIACCQFGTPPNAVCADVFPEMCFAAGFQVAPGYCGGEPVPTVCDACKLGGCADPPIAETSVCCERAAACNATVVSTTVALATFLQQCVANADQPFLGTCGAAGRCVP
jgi:hypothetical protein